MIRTAAIGFPSGLFLRPIIKKEIKLVKPEVGFVNVKKNSAVKCDFNAFPDALDCLFRSAGRKNRSSTYKLIRRNPISGLESGRGRVNAVNHFTEEKMASRMFHQAKIAAIRWKASAGGILTIFILSLTPLLMVGVHNASPLKAETLSSSGSSKKAPRETNLSPKYWPAGEMEKFKLLNNALNLLEAAEIAKFGHYTTSPDALYWLIQISRVGYFLPALPPATIKALFPDLDISLQSRLKKETAKLLWANMQSPKWRLLMQGIYQSEKKGADAAARAVEKDIRKSAHSDAVVAVDEEGNVAAICHTINTVLWGTTGIFVDGVSINDSAHQGAETRRARASARLLDRHQIRPGHRQASGCGDAPLQRIRPKLLRNWEKNPDQSRALPCGGQFSGLRQSGVQVGRLAPPGVPFRAAIGQAKGSLTG
jgi:hypothetical protein